MTGSATLHAPPGQVWQAFTNAALLARTIPGCQSLAPTAPATCRLTITTAVAATHGTYTGEAKLTGRTPDSATITATLSGAPGTGTITAHLHFSHMDNGATELAYHAEATLTGLIANVGDHLLTATAIRLATQFLSSLDAALANPAGAPQPGRSPGGAAGVASATDAIPHGASGVTAEPSPVLSQPPVALGAAPQPAAPPGAAPLFLQGMAAGAALTLAGVLAVIRARRKYR